MKILVINGPNLNMLGKRDPKRYGQTTLKQINNELKRQARKLGCRLVFFQSNHEGAIIDFLQKNSSRQAKGILINPGALTHYGYSLRDALADTKLPIVEAHLSNIKKREPFRKIDVLEDIVLKKFIGLGPRSYFFGLEALVSHLKSKNTSEVKKAREPR